MAISLKARLNVAHTVEVHMSFAGIGSRKTPPSVLNIMAQFAMFMGTRNNVLRTGGAEGADSAFMNGCKSVQGPAEIYLPWGGYQCSALEFCPDNWAVYHTVNQAALDLAAKYHPSWSKCSRGARALHARNGYIVLGRELNDPVKFIIAWTPGGDGGGGTGQALRIAKAYGIPILDLGAYPDDKLITNAINAFYTTNRSR